VNETDAAKRRKEAQQGTLVEQMMHGVIGDALEGIRGECLRAMCDPTASTEAVLHARDHLIVTEQIEAYVQRVIETGKLAKYQLEEAKS